VQRNYKEEAKKLIDAVLKIQERLRDLLMKAVDNHDKLTENDRKDYINAKKQLNKIDPAHFTLNVITIPFTETEVSLALPKNKKLRQKLREKMGRSRDDHNLFIVACALQNGWLKPLE